MCPFVADDEIEAEKKDTHFPLSPPVSYGEMMNLMRKFLVLSSSAAKPSPALFLALVFSRTEKGIRAFREKSGGLVK